MQATELRETEANILSWEEIHNSLMKMIDVQVLIETE